MPSADAISETVATATTGQNLVPERLLVSLCSLPHEALEATIANLVSAFPGQNILVATPDAAAQPAAQSSGTLSLLPYTPAAASRAAWLLTAADFLNTFKLAEEQHATVCLLLGPEAQSLSIDALHALAQAIGSGSASAGGSIIDLAVPRYSLGPREGLVNSAILYPVTRALYGTSARFPLAVDLGLSLRMAERLATVAQKFTAANQNDALLWPISEAAIAGFAIVEVPAGPRTVPTPVAADLNTLLTQIVGSLFADIDAKAAFWQRTHTNPGAPSSAQPDVSPAKTKMDRSATDSEDALIETAIAPMLDSFHLAYTNLHEIWSLILPPNSLLGLKKLSLLPAESFQMPDGLWVRIVYDFVLAYRLRTLNRGHLLGALTPLYLAWVASHLNLTAAGAISPGRHIEQLAAAFETDKSYLVSRWRWPDRFNP